MLVQAKEKRYTVADQGTSKIFTTEQSRVVQEYQPNAKNGRQLQTQHVKTKVKLKPSTAKNYHRFQEFYRARIVTVYVVRDPASFSLIAKCVIGSGRLRISF